MCNCFRFIFQVGGSVDTRQVGKKHIFARYIDSKDVIDVKTVFVAVTHANERGSLSLFICIIAAVTDLGIPI